MLFRVPGARSSLDFPGTVTRPAFAECLNWRWLPRVATKNQPSSFSSWSTSLTFIPAAYQEPLVLVTGRRPCGITPKLTGARRSSARPVERVVRPWVADAVHSLNDCCTHLGAFFVVEENLASSRPVSVSYNTYAPVSSPCANPPCTTTRLPPSRNLQRHMMP